MAHVLFVLEYDGTTDTKSKPTFVLGDPFLFVHSIIYLFARSHAFFPCLLVLLLSLGVSLCLCYLFYLSIGFVFLVYLHVHAWSTYTTSKMQAKGVCPKRAMISRLGGLTSSCGSLSLS